MPETVLLVDDAAFVRSMLREILESGGRFRVLAEASDGIAPLTLQPDLRPDLVISDLIMPELDGIEMTRALVSSDPAARIIVTAATDQEGALQEAISAGARDFLRKPFSTAEVLHVLLTPAPPEEDGIERRIRLFLSLDPDAPLAGPRSRILLRRLEEAGEILESTPSAKELPGSHPPATIEVTLRTMRPLERISEWVSGLPGIEGVTIEELPTAREARRADSPPRPHSRPRGTLRIRADLLDRLLDRVEASIRDRDSVAALLATGAGREETLPAMERMECFLEEMREAILAVRLVPFDRIGNLLDRSVREAGVALSLEASLRLSGGSTRIDLALLSGLESILLQLLPRIVGAGIGTDGPLDSTGDPGPRTLDLRVGRTGTALALTLEPARPCDPPPPDLIGESIREATRRLGGDIRVAAIDGGWRIEMQMPAGVSVVRSYLCRAGERLFAVPMEGVEEVADLDRERIVFQSGRPAWEDRSGERLPLLRFEGVPWVEADSPSRRGYPALLIRVGPLRYALAVDALLGTAEVVVRPLAGAATPGAIATAILPDGGLAVVPDLPGLARLRCS